VCAVSGVSQQSTATISQDDTNPKVQFITSFGEDSEEEEEDKEDKDKDKDAGQAASMHGTEAALGLKWKETGSKKPSTGTEIKNKLLAAALQKQVEFKKEEWEGFQVADLSSDSYIKAGSSYFRPAEAGASGELGEASTRKERSSRFGPDLSEAEKKAARLARAKQLAGLVKDKVAVVKESTDKERDADKDKGRDRKSSKDKDKRRSRSRSPRASRRRSSSRSRSPRRERRRRSASRSRSPKSKRRAKSPSRERERKHRRSSRSRSRSRDRHRKKEKHKKRDRSRECLLFPSPLFPSPVPGLNPKTSTLTAIGLIRSDYILFCSTSTRLALALALKGRTWRRQARQQREPRPQSEAQEAQALEEPLAQGLRRRSTQTAQQHEPQPQPQRQPLESSACEEVCSRDLLLPSASRKKKGRRRCQR
jgi:hypothetical protein